MDHSYQEHHASCGPGYASPNEAMEKAEREKVLHTMALYVGRDVDEPDYLATGSRRSRPGHGPRQPDDPDVRGPTLVACSKSGRWFAAR
jgi:hypothetical protein